MPRDFEMTSVPTERLVSVHSQTRGCRVERPFGRRLDHGPWLHIQLCLLPTQLQFVLTIIQTSCGVVWPCTFPLGWLYFQIGYMISLIALFTNFYIQVNLTLLWWLGFGVLAAKALIHSFIEEPLPWWERGGGGVTATVEGAEVWPDLGVLGLWHKRLWVPVGKQSCPILLPWGCCRHGIVSLNRSLSAPLP